MAVRLEGQIKRFIGLSTDTKPHRETDADGNESGRPLLAGSSFFETDTWKISRFDGVAWRYEPSNSDVVDRLDQIIELLQSISQHSEMTVATLES